MQLMAFLIKVFENAIKDVLIKGQAFCIQH